MIVKEPTGCEKQLAVIYLNWKSEITRLLHPLDDAVAVGKTIWISPYAGNVPSYMAEKTLA